MSNDFEKALKHLQSGLKGLEDTLNHLPGNVGSQMAPVMADFSKVKESLKTGDTTGLNEIISKYANTGK